MFDCITDCHTECKQQDLAPSIKCCTKDDVTYWPSVFKSSEDENELGDDVDGDTDDRPDDVDNKESDGFGVWESEELFEGGNGDEKGGTENEEARYTKELRHWRKIK